MPTARLPSLPHRCHLRPLSRNAHTAPVGARAARTRRRRRCHIHTLTQLLEAKTHQTKRALVLLLAAAALAIPLLREAEVAQEFRVHLQKERTRWR